MALTKEDIHLKVTPYDYQVEGILYCLANRKVIIGDEPGLGKTLQAIASVHTAKEYPALVICPSSLKINWEREFSKFTDARALVLTDNVSTTWPYLLQTGMYQVAICNYESLRKYFVWDVRASASASQRTYVQQGRPPEKTAPFRLKDVVFNPAISLFRSIIIDESHRLKDPTAQQTIFSKGLSIGRNMTILLSGTPVVNHPKDLCAQLSILERLPDFGGAKEFMARFGDGDNLSELSSLLYQHCMIRREKSSVLTQLPDKTRCDLIVEISNRQEYDAAEQDLAQYLREYKDCTEREIRRKMRMEALVKFMTLRSIASMGKVKPAIDFIRCFLASGKPLIVFCSLHDIVDQLLKEFPDAVSVTGRDSMQDKQAAVDDFQQGRAQLIICSIKAAGVGLTLTASSNVAFVEFPWTYADCCQCEDRAHRIGQRDNVSIYYLLGQHTIDRALYNIIHRKRAIASQIMATDDDIPEDETYFDELVSSFLSKSAQ